MGRCGQVGGIDETGLVLDYWDWLGRVSELFDGSLQ